MRTVRPPFFLRWFSPGYLLCEMPAAGKVIYLTFDDGPIPETTPEVLSILRQYQALATFFVVGDNVRKHPEVFAMVQEAGHSFGNHTFHHLNGWRTSPGAYLYDVQRCGEYFSTRLFRPPYGRFTPSQYLLLRKDFRFILWSVLTYDFKGNISPEKCLDSSIRCTRNGSIVVFHDSLKSITNVRYALPRFLEHFMALGYRFEPIIYQGS